MTSLILRASALALIATFGLAAGARADTLLSQNFNTGAAPGWSFTDGAVIFDEGTYGDSLLLDAGDKFLSTASLPSIAVVPGAQYVLSFDHGTIGSEGPFCCTSGPHPVLVTLGGGFTLISTTEDGVTNDNNNLGFLGFSVNVAFNGAQPAAADYEHDVVTFIATGSSLQISLQDNGPFPAHLGGAAVVDNVLLTGEAVRGGVPEPATWAVMILGFGLAGAALRRRRTAVAA